MAGEHVAKNLFDGSKNPGYPVPSQRRRNSKIGKLRTNYIRKNVPVLLLIYKRGHFSL